MSAEVFVYITCNYEGCTARTTGEWDRDRWGAVTGEDEQLGWWSHAWEDEDLCPDHSPWLVDKRYEYEKVEEERLYTKWLEKRAAEREADIAARERRLAASTAAFSARQENMGEFLELWQANGGGFIRRGP